MRNLYSLNQGWTLSFPKGERETETVNLPHTWNAVDGMDGNGSYLRTTAVYTRTFKAPTQPLAGGRLYVEIPAAALKATVRINGKDAVTHEGGYSCFRADITDLCVAGDNEISIEVSNEDTPTMYPASADFTFYGGLYRGVNLISVPETHFDLDYYGGPGIMVTPKPTEDGGADFTVQAFVTNAGDDFTVQYILEDPYGWEIAGAVRPSDNTAVTLHVPEAVLWSMDEPNLYTVTARLNRRNETYDEIILNAGVRSFAVTPDGGFSINGVATPLRCVSRHQDRLYKGNALTAEDHYEDAQIIKDLGANTIRLAHYQHSQDFYDACDQLGFAVWAEIPFISVFKPGDAAHEHCRQEMKELVIQNYNHPSIMFWGISNEILIGGISQELVDRHHDLQKLVKELDPTRLTTIAHVSHTPTEGPMHHITDLESYNHYFGWYGGKTEMYGPWFDKFHKKYPDRAVGMSEYGCEALNWHTSDPQQGDYTEEYQAKYHEDVIRQIAARPWMWSTHVWNMFDFAADARSEGGENGMNHKGLVTFDRQYKKDAFYAYKAWLSKEPFVHICGKRYVDRTEDVTKVTVYTNQPQVELFANGKSLGVQQKGEYPFFYFDVPNSGETTLTAKAGDCTDESHLRHVNEPNRDYVLQEEGAVINWFEIETPPGYMSINDTIGDILATTRGKLLALRIVQMVRANMKKNKGGSTGGMADMAKGMKINKSLIDMGKGFTVKRVCMMAGGLFTKEQILEINAKLNKIKKKQK